MCGRAQQDWTADYRLYSRDRVKPEVLFSHVLSELEVNLPALTPLVAAIDDTLVRKTGVKIDGVGWKRDPLGPAFQTNLVRGQRYVQLSAAWPGADGQGRMIPVDFTHAPTPPKPGKNATADQVHHYKEQQKQQRLNVVALARIQQLRQALPEARKLVVAGDGGYTNAVLLKGLPDKTVYIGRIRRDAAFNALPGPPATTGRPSVYGAPVQTPDGLRTDNTVPWQSVEAHASGKKHTLKIKTLGPVLWRKAGATLPLQVMVIAPVGYRLRAGSRLLYRQPAFLACTDPDMPVGEQLQYYLWRWGIEGNFRDEKNLIGTGQAQLRTAASNRNQPAATVAAYALLLIAALLFGHPAGQSPDPPPHLRPPKWRTHSAGASPATRSTGDLLRTLRSDCWADQIASAGFSDFASTAPTFTNPWKDTPFLAEALFRTA
jgi:hypothetical protein